jgi:hypothetical protein
MERGVWCGMAIRKGIVFDHGNTGWGYEKAFCVFCCQQDCVWEEAKSEMIEYSSSLPEDTANNGRRHMLYRQMVIRGRTETNYWVKVTVSSYRNVFYPAFASFPHLMTVNTWGTVTRNLPAHKCQVFGIHTTIRNGPS